MSTRAKRRLSLHLRLVLLTVTMILLLVAPLSPPRTSAKRGCLWYKRVHHYTDVNYTTSCGVSTYMCDGSIAHAGCWTAFSVVTQECQCIEE